MRVIAADSDRATLELTARELDLLQSAIFDVFHGTTLPVEEWEFSNTYGRA